MILHLTTVHENGSLEVTPVFSTKASAIFIAAKDLTLVLRVNSARNLALKGFGGRARFLVACGSSE